MSRHNKSTPQTIFASTALTPEGWKANVRLSIKQGRISAITEAKSAEVGDIRVDVLIPAMANLHSHTFQRAMAGMTEHRAANAESFWTWRDLMYRFLEHLTPDDIEAIAALAFMEMLETGYASVAEFHYIHHQRQGVPYENPAELSLRILAAAQATGIGITHLPVLYCHGGANAQPLAGGQLRFGNALDAFSNLHEQVQRHMALAMPEDAAVGMAPHSLRAVTPHVLNEAAARFSTGPIHIHIAEQQREVDEIRQWLGKRPVEWLLGNAKVDKRWCLIHATHMTADETAGVARSGAVAGLCPITEANLGDGIFNGKAFNAECGIWGIGTDSNVRISLRDELQMLEYSQRLREQARNVLATEPGSTGTQAFVRALSGGAQALQRDCGSIAPGKWADLTAITRNSAALCGLSDKELLDGWIFASGNDAITDVWSAGRHCVRGGHHTDKDAVTSRYCATLKKIVQKL